MRTYLGHAVVALALAAGTQTAGAQQWIYTPDNRAIVDTQPLALTQAQRTIIYRTIVPQGRGRRPIVREQIITEPVAPPVVRERVVTPRWGNGYGVDAYAYGDTYAYGDSYAYGNGYSYGYAPAPRERYAVEPNGYGAYAYAVGTRVSPNARLAPMPPALVAQVPAVRSYQYMVVAGRLLLVDPDTGIVVAEVTR